MKSFQRGAGTHLAALAFVWSLGIIGFVPQAVRGQSMNQCIDGCWGSCSSYPLGSHEKQACVDRCLEFTCKKLSANIWGAIAYSRSDKISGWSYEQVDKATAENLAMRYCLKQGGSKCQVEATFYRSCGSLAADGNIVGWGTSGTKQAAQQRSLTECSKAGGRNCEVQAWACSAPTGSSSDNAPSSTTPPVPRAASWGAIAYSSPDMGAGWSQGKDDRASAEREAMNACMKRGHACVLQTAFNKECGALAADGSFTGWGASTDQRQAQQKAIDACRRAGGSRCALHIAFCSY